MTARSPENLNHAHEIAIVGNDLLLQALPARPVQVSHALLAAGYALVVPASWGDELLAEHATRHVLAVDARPRIYCSCPRVRQRLLATGNELAPHLLALVAPPVAAARYLRSAWPEQALRITYIGNCASADDPAIDRQLAPSALLRQLEVRGIDPTRMPLAFHDVIPPDRSRYWSLPGGCPSPDALREHAAACELRIVGRDDLAQDVVEGLLSGARVVLDLADAVDCACAGAVQLHGAGTSRDAVAALEPPRALRPVLDPEVVVDVEYRHRLTLARDTGPSSNGHEPLAATPVSSAEPVIDVPALTADEVPPPLDDRRRRPLALTPPGIATIGAREGRQPPPQPFVGVVPHTPLAVDVPRSASLVSATHALHRLARTRPGLRVSREGGPSVPRAFAAVRRTPVAIDPSPHQELPVVPSMEDVAAEANPTPVASSMDEVRPERIDAVPDQGSLHLVDPDGGLDEVPPGAIETPEMEPPHHAEDPTTAPDAAPPHPTHADGNPEESSHPEPAGHATVAPGTSADAPTLPAESAEPKGPPVFPSPLKSPRPAASSAAPIRPSRLTPIPSPSPPHPRRLWGLLASVALVIALTLLLFAVFGS
jgi:hypothetical protein